MKELIIFNIIILLIYFFVSYKLLTGNNGQPIFSKFISELILTILIPIIICILNQIFILIFKLDKRYIWFTSVYLFPPIIKFIVSFLKNYKAEKFYKKYHNEVTEYVIGYLKENKIKKRNTKILLFLDIYDRKLGNHKIIIKNIKEKKDFKDLLKIELFSKFNLMFDVLVEN